jgi:hypothetical protein
LRGEIVILEATLAARKPLRKKRATKRRQLLPRCKVLRCQRIARFEELCPTHAKREADRLARLVVLNRDNWTCQRCQTQGEVGNPIQWCHVLTRASLSLRWEPENSMALCHSDHYFFTVQPHRWDAFLNEKWPGRRERLHLMRQEALERGDKPDYAEIIASLRSQASGLVGKEP